MKFSEEFYAKSKTAQIEYLVSLASSQNNALDLMQKERNQLATELNTIKGQLKSIETSMTVNKQIMQNSLTGFNAEKDGYIKRIQELEAEVRTLKGDKKALENKLKGQ